MVKCMLNTHKARSLVPSTGYIVIHAYKLSTQQLQAEKSEVPDSLSYTRHRYIHTRETEKTEKTGSKYFGL